MVLFRAYLLLALSLSVAVLIIVFSVMNGFDRELRERILALVPHVTMTTMRNEALMNQEQWQVIQATVDDNPEVAASAPLIQLQGMLLSQRPVPRHYLKRRRSRR